MQKKKNSNNLYTKYRIRQLEQENKRLLLGKAYLKELRQSIKEAIYALPASKQIKPPTLKTANASTCFLVFSDWHIGEVISKDAVGSYGGFNYDIAQKRLQEIVFSMLNWIKRERPSEVVLLFLGDYISGNIHDELLHTNEFPEPVQAINAGSLVAWVVEEFAKKSANVRVCGVAADNHGRLRKKPYHKQKSLANYSYIVLEFAKQRTENIKHVNFEIYPAAKTTIKAGGKKLLLMHGDGIKSWGGIPYYGLERASMRESIFAKHFPAHTFDYMVLGHFHVPCKLGSNILINGSLSGTSEFDYSCGRFSAPCQIGFKLEPNFVFLEFNATC